MSRRSRYGRGYGYDYGWRPYVPVAEKSRAADREVEKLAKKGHPVAPVRIEGRAIAQTFWGKAWCDHLEAYSDYSNRLPRGRSYVRNGFVVDLQVAPSEVKVLVMGSSLYRVTVGVKPLPAARWQAICADCAGAIDSLVELLQGRLSKGVMERICRQGEGPFPTPGELSLKCSCPDWASMCKHVAAALYGIGARLDESPELLFRLRGVDERQLIARAAEGLPLARTGPAADRVLADEDLSALFGLELAAPAAEAPARTSRARRPKKEADPATEPGRKPRAPEPKPEAPSQGPRSRKPTAKKPPVRGRKPRAPKPEADAPTPATAKAAATRRKPRAPKPEADAPTPATERAGAPPRKHRAPRPKADASTPAPTEAAAPHRKAPRARPTPADRPTTEAAPDGPASRRRGAADPAATEPRARTPRPRRPARPARTG